MAVTSLFGVWDQEVKTLIQDLSSQSKLSASVLTEWFYSEGVLIFQKAQSSSYDQEVKSHQDKYGKRPVISATTMLGQKFIGFMALLPELTKKFAQEDNTPEYYINGKFHSFVITAVNQHTSFYSVQAEVSTKLNQLLDADPTMPQNTIFKFVIEAFLEHKNTKPELSAEIDNHVQFMKEFAAYMRKQRPLSSSSVSLFQASAAQTTPVRVDKVSENASNGFN